MNTQRIAFYLILSLMLLLSNTTLLAQNKEPLHFFIDLPLMEYPYDFNHRYQAATMQQSIKLSKSFYYSLHGGLDILGKNKLGKKGAIWSKVFMTILDFAPLPLSNTWLHEEWHRSILTLNHIKSKNGHWTNSVKHIDDDDLINLKLNSPQDLVREATAGNEGNLEFVHSLEKDVFFNQVNTWNYGLYWGNYLVNSFYLFGSTRTNSKPLVRFKNKEDEHIHKRDANGFDPINATYDLFHPNSPYEDRGIHPSGHGIDRYIEFNDLSPAGQQFLKTQFSLSLLNFLDMNLIGVDELGKKMKYNLSIRHHMTPFGYMVGVNFLFKKNQFGGMVKPKIYRNERNTFLGLDVELRNNWGQIRLAGWQQPENLLYYDTNAAFGGLIGAKIYPFQKSQIHPYFEGTLKSKGWVAGHPYLGGNFSFLLGLRIRLKEKVKAK